MKIVSIGGGPAGLYFAILMKQADPSHEITVIERNRPDDTFGFGVVFSDATLSNIAEADPETNRQIRAGFAHWDDIDTHIGGKVIRSTGHGFCGLERAELLGILQRRCEHLGVDLQFETEVTDFDAHRDADLVLGADGVASGVRSHYAEHFGPRVEDRPNRFVWLGTTFPFDAFTFYFTSSPAGLFRVHAYRYSEERSTFIVECTDDTFQRTGLSETDEDATIAYLEDVFKDELAGHPLIKNRSIWRRFPNVTNDHWHHGNVVLMGDAVHTAHFSIGSGTKLAMEDAIALRDALAKGGSVGDALARYEAARRPEVESLQRAAQVSLEWFENTERYMHLEPEQFTFSLLTRSLRVTHANLRVRDPELVERVDRWFSGGEAVPPRTVPYQLGSVELPSRIVRVWQGDAGAVADAGLVMIDGVRPGDVSAAASAVKSIADAGHKVGVQIVGEGKPQELAAAANSAVELGADVVELECSLASALGRAGDDAVLAAVEDVCAALPGGTPLSVRISGTDWLPGGRTGADAARLAAALQKRGVHIVAVTADPVLEGANPHRGRLYMTPLSDQVRNEARVATMTEGNISSYDDINSILAAGRADLCVLGRHAIDRAFDTTD